MRSLLKVIFSGTSIGIALLMLGYVGIYYLSGQEIFMQEIVRLGEIQTLQTQLFITGISGMLIAVSIYYIEKAMKQEEKVTYKIVLGGLFLTVSAIFAMMLNEKMDENISNMMTIISASLVCIYAFINSVRILWSDVSSIINKDTEKGNQ